jgi:uncharacterized protein YhdP
VTPRAASTELEPKAGTPDPAATPRTPLSAIKWLRTTVMVTLAVGTLAAIGVLAYELALARVPQHRAALERLVRAQTGLDVRFNELGVRLGWYGPEAVFRRVELGEPGRSNVLLRAPQLIVGFDAWRTLQTGKLEAGRITLVAPDIDLERLTSSRAATGAPQHQAPVEPRKAKILQRWRGGRIELQGGTVRLPDPGGSANPLSVQIRRATIRRSEDRWNAFGLVFLPERLGGTARITVQLEGDLEAPSTWNGAVRFDGTRLLFRGWHDVLAYSPALSRALPVSGGGDVMLRARFEKGRVERADGEIRADDVSLDAPPWLADDPVARAPGRGLRLAYVSGNWRAARRDTGWQVQIDKLALDRPEKETTLPTLWFEVTKRGANGRLAQAPLDSLAQIARWLNPNLDAAQVTLDGTARNIEFEWNASQPPGYKLRASASVQRASLAARSESFAVHGLNARITGTERVVDFDVTSKDARLELRGALDEPLESLKLASRLRLQTTADGWKLSTSQFTLDSDAAHLQLSGSVTTDARHVAPTIAVRGTVPEADVERLQKTFGSSLVRAFGANAARVASGRIENAKFELTSMLDPVASEKTAPAFRGTLALRDAKLAGDELWPDAEGVNARVTWNGPRMRINVDSGRAGAFQLSEGLAQWSTDDRRPTRISGHAKGRLEQVLPWLGTHPHLHEFVPNVHEVLARGDASFDFEVSVPAAAGAKTPPRPSVRVVTSFESASLKVVRDLPSIDSVRGTLAFEAGKLQRSTLAAKWLGGPLTLRVSERRERQNTTIAVQAQGLVNAGQLAALSTIGSARAVSGEAPWSGEFSYVPAHGDKLAQWKGKADANLTSVVSTLPNPLQKAVGTAMPLHLEASGSGDAAVLRVSASDRVRTIFALQRVSGADWRVERGEVHLGPGAADLPDESVVRVEGKVSRVDLPAYVSTWQRVRREATAPPVTLAIEAEELEVAGRSYSDVKLHAFTNDGSPELQVESEALDGVVRWPGRNDRNAPIDVRFTRLSVPERTESGTVTDALNVLGATATVFADRFSWHGRALGRFSARIDTRDDQIKLEDLRVAGGDHNGRGSVECGSKMDACRARFELETDDAAATLVAFGFRPDVRATQASVSGDFEWQPDSTKSLLETAVGRVSLRLNDGATRIADASSVRPFALFTVPALLHGIARPPGSDGTTQPNAPQELAFRRLEADFDLKDGQARTSDLHFDGDAEILVHGRTGLLARDYDHTAWILRGEERIPAAVRRLGAAPRVAAAWMTLRDLLRGESSDRARIELHLRGSWSDPIVTLE